MKYLLAFFLFLSGCASERLSDYNQGCVDGAIQLMKDEENRFSEYLSDPVNEAYVRESLTKYLCAPLEHKKNQEDHAYPKNR